MNPFLWQPLLAIDVWEVRMLQYMFLSLVSFLFPKNTPLLTILFTSANSMHTTRITRLDGE